MYRFIFLTFLIISFMMTGCGKKETADPEVSLHFTVSKLTNEDYRSVGTYLIENPTIDDFRKVHLDVVMKNSDKITNRDIVIPNLKDTVNSTDTETGRYWFGNGYDNVSGQGENYPAECSRDFVFYSRGLTEDDLKELFSSSEIKVSWTSEKEGDAEKTYNLGEMIEFQ